MNLEQATIAAVHKAGEHIKKNAFGFGEVEWKKKDDPVTAMDREGERMFKEEMGKVGTFNYLGEEYGLEDNGSNITFYIDPIDGTKSFVRRDFYTSMSVGIEEDGTLIGGIVYDFMRGITYVGFRGKSHILYDGEKHSFRAEATYRKNSISINDAPKLQRELDGIGLKTIEKHGSIALGMAELAAGNYDGMISNSVGKGNAWDVAAGYYLLTTNGFEVRDYYGEPFNYRKGDGGIIALRRNLIDIIQENAKETKGKYHIWQTAQKLRGLYDPLVVHPIEHPKKYERVAELLKAPSPGAF